MASSLRRVILHRRILLCPCPFAAYQDGAAFSSYLACLSCAARSCLQIFSHLVALYEVAFEVDIITREESKPQTGV